MSNRTLKAPTGTQLNAKSWLTEAPMRMLMNNLDPDVAERPEDLVVYGGIGKAARNWACYDAIVESLQQLEDDETLLVQSGSWCVQNPCRCTKGINRQLKPGAQLGQLGSFQ